MIEILHWFKLWSSSENTQFLIHNKPTYTSQLVKGKSSDLPKLLRSLSGIVTSMFKFGTGGCGGWYSTYGVCVGVTSVFFLLSLSNTKMSYPQKHHHQDC